MIRERQQKNFNKYHCASPLKLLRSGDMVYIPDNEREYKNLQLCLILCRHLKIRIYRRDHRHLVPLPTAENNSQAIDPLDTLPEGVS